MPISAGAGRLPPRLGLAIVVAILVLLFGFGSTPASANLIASPWDKLLHAAIFAALAMGLRILLPRLPFSLIIGLGLSVALADELHQVFVPGRQPGWDDGLADLLGIAGGLLAQPWLQRAFAPAFLPCRR